VVVVVVVRENPCGWLFFKGATSGFMESRGE